MTGNELINSGLREIASALKEIASEMGTRNEIERERNKYLAENAKGVVSK